MPQVELTAGTIEYEEAGPPDAPVVVLLHGVAMDATVWRHVVAHLATDHRCILPTLPLGAHRLPMKPDAELTILALVRLVAELLEALDLRDVTLVGNDWGGAQLLVSEGLDERVGRLALVACEAFENYPPGLPGRNLALAGRVPGGLTALIKPLRIRALRRLPVALGWMSKRPVPDAVVDGWLEPAMRQAAVRRDLRKYVQTRFDKAEMRAWAERQRAFTRPVLVVWAKEDRIMPREHGPRLAALFADARLVEVDDSYTLIPEDQPGVLARELRAFVGAAQPVR